MIHVTAHAIERFRERVAPVDSKTARQALTTPAIQAAAEFGAMYVRLGTGHRIVIENGAVVTVLPARGHKLGAMSPRRRPYSGPRRQHHGRRS